MGSQAGLLKFVNLMSDEDLEEDLLIGGLFDALGKENLLQLSPPREEGRTGKRKRAAGLDSEAWLDELCAIAPDLKHGVAPERVEKGSGSGQEEAKSEVEDTQEAQSTKCPHAEEESEGSDDDCVMLDGNPEASKGGEKETGLGGEGVADEEADELEVTKEVGLVACRDFPHARFSCVKFPFKRGAHKDYCSLCHCYVCDVPAPCPSWGDGRSVINHCHADHKDPFWKNMRQSLKQQAARKLAAKKARLEGSAPPPAGVTETFQLWGVQNGSGEGGAPQGLGDSAWGQISFEACFGTVAWGRAPGDLQGPVSPSEVPAGGVESPWARNRYLRAITRRLAAQNGGVASMAAGAPGGAIPVPVGGHSSHARAAQRGSHSEAGRRALQSPKTPSRTPLDFAPSPPPPLPTEGPPPPPTEPFPGAGPAAAEPPLHNIYQHSQTNAAVSPQPPLPSIQQILYPSDKGVSGFRASVPNSGLHPPGGAHLNPQTPFWTQGASGAWPSGSWNAVPPAPTFQGFPHSGPIHTARQAAFPGGFAGPQDPAVQLQSFPASQDGLHAYSGLRSGMPGFRSWTHPSIQGYSTQALYPPPLHLPVSAPNAAPLRQGGVPVGGAGDTQANSFRGVMGDGNGTGQGLAVASVWQPVNQVGRLNDNQGPEPWKATGTWESESEAACSGNKTKPTEQDSVQMGRASAYEIGTEYDPWEQPWSWSC